MGDVKMMAMVGAFLAGPGIPYNIHRITCGKHHRSLTHTIPGKKHADEAGLRTFLGMGALLAVFFGPAVISCIPRHSNLQNDLDSLDQNELLPLDNMCAKQAIKFGTRAVPS